MKQRCFLAITALCFLTLSAGASTAAPVLKVGVNHFLPLATIDAQGRAGGLFVEVLDHIAEAEGWQLQYVPCAWAQCLQGLQQGEFDLLATIAASPERERVFDFTRQYLSSKRGRCSGATAVPSKRSSISTARPSPCSKTTSTPPDSGNSRRSFPWGFSCWKKRITGR